jgi:hypothetical protein
MADKSGQKSTTDTDPQYNYTIHAAVFCVMKRIIIELL